MLLIKKTKTKIGLRLSLNKTLSFPNLPNKRAERVFHVRQRCRFIYLSILTVVEA